MWEIKDIKSFEMTLIWRSHWSPTKKKNENVTTGDAVHQHKESGEGKLEGKLSIAALECEVPKGHSIDIWK